MGLSKKRQREMAMHLLRNLRLETRADFMGQELSGGQQQLAAIARALINDPEIILADEPLSNIDSKHVANVLSILTELKSQGKTIIATSHRKSGFKDLADSIYYFNQGTISSRQR